MSKLQQQINANTETIISLIDQTLISSQRTAADNDSTNPKSSTL